MIASRDQIINENNASVNASYSGSIEVPEAALPGNMKIQFSDSNNSISLKQSARV